MTSLRYPYPPVSTIAYRSVLASIAAIPFLPFLAVVAGMSVGAAVAIAVEKLRRRK